MCLTASRRSPSTPVSRKYQSSHFLVSRTTWGLDMSTFIPIR